MTDPSAQKQDMREEGFTKGDLQAYYLDASQTQPHLNPILEHLMNTEKTEQNEEQQQEKSDRFLSKLFSCSTFHWHFKKKIIGLQKMPWKLQHECLLFR